MALDAHDTALENLLFLVDQLRGKLVPITDLSKDTAMGEGNGALQYTSPRAQQVEKHTGIVNEQLRKLTELLELTHP